MSLWHRIARLLRQSRIRLPREPPTADELHPGDWVQLGSETWRVMTRRFEVDRVVFRLRPLRGTVGAVLVGPLEDPSHVKTSRDYVRKKAWFSSSSP